MALWHGISKRHVDCGSCFHSVGYSASSPDSLPQRHPFGALHCFPHMSNLTVPQPFAPQRIPWWTGSTERVETSVYIPNIEIIVLKLRMYWCSIGVMVLRDFSIMSFLGATYVPGSVLSLWCAHTWSSHSPRKTILLCSFYGWGNWGLEKWRKIFWVSSLGSDRPIESMGPLDTNLGLRSLKELNALTPSSGDGLKAAQGTTLLSSPDRVPRAFQQPAVLRNCPETQGHRVATWILLYHPKEEIKSLPLVSITWG